MSSDYLNYELSKELHDLGVVFEGGKHWASGTLMCASLAEQFYDNETGASIPAPSTTMLIDEIGKLYPFTLCTYWKSDRKLDIDSYKVTNISGSEVYGNDPCATTALGKALIALVKEGK